MINPTLHVNKEFKEQVKKCMNDTFGTITQPFIKNTMKNKNTFVLALVICSKPCIFKLLEVAP